MAFVQWVATLLCVLTLLSECEGWMKGKGGKTWGAYPPPPSHPNHPRPNPYSPPDPWNRGSGCQGNEDCHPGSTCVKDSASNTYGTCKDRCENHAQCPASFVCIKKYANAQYKKCRTPPSCTRDNDCEAGLVCTMKILPRSQHRMCLPKCSSTTGSEGCRSKEMCVKNKGAQFGGCTWVKECFSLFSCAGMWSRTNTYSYCQEGGQGHGYCIPNGVERDEVVVDGDDVQIILNPQNGMNGNEDRNSSLDNGEDIFEGNDGDGGGVQLVTRKPDSTIKRK